MKPGMLGKGLVAMGLAALLSGCAHLYQACNEVLVRDPGTRTYDDSQARPVKAWAQQVRELAALSDLVYTRNWDREHCMGKKEPVREDPKGWTKWRDFPSPSLAGDACDEGLYFEVWQSPQSPQEVVVAFRGTDFTSLKDWKANLRWLTRLLPFYRDQYTVVSRDLSGEFRDELSRRIRTGETGADAVVTATGHSLGGGLAQHFAYAFKVPGDASVATATALPRITTMTVFDPSPVTGWSSVPWKTRRRNAEGLTIDRVFEHGEALSYVRLATSLVWPPSERNPAIREIRFNFDPSVNFIENHSMSILADGLRDAADGQGACSQ
jgi:hypothetical protein